MARTRKSFEQQLMILDEQIDKVQEKLNGLMAQRETLLIKKREEEIGDLYQVLQENGLSAQDILKMIEQERYDDAQAS